MGKISEITRKITTRLKQRGREEINPVESWSSVTFPPDACLVSPLKHTAWFTPRFPWSEHLGNKFIDHFKDPGEVLGNDIFCALRWLANLTFFVVMFNWDLFTVS